MRVSILRHLSYLSNFFFAWRGEYMGDVSHFWSLAVEEQFYLFWPFVILFLPRRFLLPFIVLCIVIAPCFRFIIAFFLQGNEVAVNVLPFSSLDSLAGGSLLAALHRRMDAPASRRLLRCVCGMSIVSAFAYIMLRTVVPVPDGMAPEGLFIARALLAPGLFAIVWFTACGIPGRVGAVLESKPLAYIGKISYGIYVFHFFVPGATAWLCDRFGYPLWEELGTYPYLFLNLAVLLLLSALSWHFFESRINILKRAFPYAANSNHARPKMSLSLLFMRLVPRRTQ